MVLKFKSLNTQTYRVYICTCTYVFVLARNLWGDAWLGKFQFSFVCIVHRSLQQAFLRTVACCTLYLYYLLCKFFFWAWACLLKVLTQLDRREESWKYKMKSIEMEWRGLERSERVIIRWDAERLVTPNYFKNLNTKIQIYVILYCKYIAGVYR